MTDTAKKRLTVEIDATLHRQLKAQAALSGAPLRALVVSALRQRIDAPRPPPVPRNKP